MLPSCLFFRREWPIQGGECDQLSGDSPSIIIRLEYTCTVYSTHNRFLPQWSRGWQGEALAVPAQCSLPANLSWHRQILHHRWLQVSHTQYTCTLEQYTKLELGDIMSRVKKYYFLFPSLSRKKLSKLWLGKDFLILWPLFLVTIMTARWVLMTGRPSERLETLTPSLMIPGNSWAVDNF